MKPTTVLAFVALCAITFVPTASALDQHAAAERAIEQPDICLLAPRTLEESEPDADGAAADLVARCTAFGLTLRDMTVPGVGGPTYALGDDSRIGVRHEVGLGGSVYVQHNEDGVSLHWAQGITHCWITVPTDGSPASGPQCVY